MKKYKLVDFLKKKQMTQQQMGKIFGLTQAGISVLVVKKRNVFVVVDGDDMRLTEEKLLAVNVKA